MTEVGYDTVDETSPTSEFVEILNPDPSPFALDGAPDMIPWGSNPAGTLSMANNGECVGLAFWDGIGDRVVDHDWGVLAHDQRDPRQGCGLSPRSGRARRRPRVQLVLG